MTLEAIDAYVNASFWVTGFNQFGLLTWQITKDTENNGYLSLLSESVAKLGTERGLFFVFKFLNNFTFCQPNPV